MKNDPTGCFFIVACIALLPVAIMLALALGDVFFINYPSLVQPAKWLFVFVVVAVSAWLIWDENTNPKYK